MGVYTTEAFAPPYAREIGRELNATLGGVAKSLRLSDGEGRGRVEALRRYLADDAAHGLLRRQPEYSAATVITPRQKKVLLLLGFSILLLLTISPATAGVVLTALVLVAYLANGVFRAWLFWVGSEDASPNAPTADISDADLPIYTVLVPLYRETSVLPQLAAALRMLDYPSDRLDVRLVVEEDDADTIAAIEQFVGDGRFDVIAVPVGEPRTKPRACNYALPFARGEFLVIFDAEDRPEPDQLKKAVCAFRGQSASVACLQARLNFFDARKRWLARLFALDYALWFDFLLPGLDKLRIPMPLGGTSNHFRLDALRAIGGWDPFNVTEDADLGIRLARLGLSVRTLDSTTYEEATTGLWNWLRQRTRWTKGYMQTSTNFFEPYKPMA